MANINRPSWHHTFMSIAYDIAKRSPDAQTKCGSVIVNKSNHIISVGYNGFVSNIDDDILPNTRPDKYDYMLHSELNALLNAESSVVGATIYVTSHPCLHCYQCLLQAKVTRVVFNANTPNAVMVDKDMMAKINRLQKMTGERMEMFSYTYEPVKECQCHMYDDKPMAMFRDDQICLEITRGYVL